MVIKPSWKYHSFFRGEMDVDSSSIFKLKRFYGSGTVIVLDDVLHFYRKLSHPIYTQT